MTWESLEVAVTPDDDRLLAGDLAFRRFLAGKQHALTDLVNLYGPGLQRFVAGIVADRALAEDLTAEAFTRLVLAKGQFQAESSVKTYLFAIGRNLALDHLKKNRRRAHGLHSARPRLDPEAVAITDSAEDAYLRKEATTALHQAVGQLAPDHRDAVVLVHIERLSYAEAAQVLHKTETQVRGLAYRARAALRGILETSASGGGKILGADGA